MAEKNSRFIFLLQFLNRPDRKLLMIMNAIAHMDDSGSEPESPVCVVAGFVATVPVWDNFSKRWDNVLRGRRKIDYFKMSQAESRKGQFEGFAETERDAKVSALVNVIRNTADLLIISAVVSWKDYDDVVKTRVRPEIDHPFFVGFHTVIAKMAQQKRAGSFPNAVDFIFDDGSPYGEAAVKFYKLMRTRALAIADETLLSSLGQDPITRDDRQALPLQAADLLAWHIRRHLDKTLPENSAPTYMRPVLQLLAQLPKIDMLLAQPELKAYVHEFQ